MTTFHANIGGTDFGPAGLNALVGVTLTPSGPGKIGAAKLTLQKAGGGYTFANLIEIQLYETDGANTVVWRWFGGFVTRVTTRRVAGTNLKIYELDCQDYNLLLQTLVCDAKTTLVLDADTAVNQIADLFSQLTSGASKGIDATSDVADLLPAVTLPDVHARGKTAAVILDRIFTNVRLADSTIRPAAFLGLDSTNGLRGNFGLPTLQVYDRASPPSATVTLTDENSTIRQNEGFVRTLDAAKLVTWRQVIVDQTGGVHDAPDTTAAALYPNPYDPDGYWRDVPLEDKDSTTDADAIALATATVQKVSNPRETIQLTTIERVRPGDFVSVTWTLEGLAGQVYEVVETNVEFEAKDPARPVYHLTLGARKRALGETDDDSLSVPPVIYDLVPPDQPATPTYTTTYNRASDSSTVIISWTANTEDDMDHYLLRLARGAAYSVWIVVAAMASPQYTYTTTPGETFTASVQALDTSGNTSPASATLSGTAHAAVAEDPGPPATVTVTTTRTSVNQARADVSWSAGTGGTGTPDVYDVRYYVTSAGSSTATIIRAPNDNRVLSVPGLVVGTGYTFNVRSVTAYGDAGAWSTGVTVTAGVEAPGPPATLTVTGSRTGPGQGQAALSWTAGTGGTGTPDRYDVRYYATASGSSSATILRCPNDTRQMVIPGLAVGVGYTFNVRSVTAFGDAGAWSTGQTLTLAAEAPPAPTGLTVLDYDPGQTGQSAWILLGWTAGTGGTGTVATWNVRVDWTESSTGIVRKWHRDGIPATDLSTILAPLTAGPSYTITMWGVTNWGDISSAATLVYSITPPITTGLYNGSFEIPDPTDKTQPDGWTIAVTIGTAAVSLSSTQVLDGAQSVKIVRSGAGAAAVTLTSRRFAVQPGQWLYLTGAVYGLYNVSCTVAPAVDFYQQDGTPSSGLIGLGVFNAANPGPGWGQSSQLSSGMVPADAVTGELQLTVGIDTSQTTVYLDGFTLSAGVITDRLAPAAVTTAKLAAGAVDSTVLADGSVIAAKIGTSAVTNTKLQNNAVNAAKINADAVTTVKILDANVTTAKIADDAVTQAKIGPAAVGPTELADGTLAKNHWGSNMAAVQKATSAPASPASGDTVFRSDIGRLGYYDGTRWLNTAPEIVNFVLTSGLSTPFPNTLAAGTGVYVAPKRQDLAYWLERGDLAAFVNTTNNASNYWTIALVAVSSAGVKTTLASTNTSAGAPNAYLALPLTSFSGNPISTTGAIWLEIDLTKTGSPGSIYVYPQLTIREVLP